MHHRWDRVLGYLLDIGEVEDHKKTTWMSGKRDVPASGVSGPWAPLPYDD
jgi:hypothetical protein